MENKKLRVFAFLLLFTSSCCASDAESISKLVAYGLAAGAGAALLCILYTTPEVTITCDSITSFSNGTTVHAHQEISGVYMEESSCIQQTLQTGGAAEYRVEQQLRNVRLGKGARLVRSVTISGGSRSTVIQRDEGFDVPSACSDERVFDSTRK